MGYELTLDIAGIPLLVHAAQREWLEPIAERFGPFTSWSSSKQDNPIHVSLSFTRDVHRALNWDYQYEPSPAAAFGLDIDTTPTKAVIERSEDGSVRTFSAAYDGTWDGKQKAELTLFLEPLVMGFEGFLLGILPDVLLAHDACVLHASGLVSGSHAYLFSGPSGAGKTTVVENSPEMIVLSDELVIVRAHDDGTMWAYGTPFFGSWGKPGTPTSAPIAWLHFLQKATTNRLESLSARERFRRLCGVICYRNSHQRAGERLLEFAERLMPLCRLLHSRPGPAIWPLIEGKNHAVEAKCSHQSAQL